MPRVQNALRKKKIKELTGADEKKLAAILCLCMIILAACSTEYANRTSVPNREKPIVWVNVQPSNSITGELEMDALAYNDKTWFVGGDYRQGGELQGQMVYDYLVSHGAAADRNGDGGIGYVLLIGDIGHNDSITRTRGVRKVLNTAVPDPLQGLSAVLKWRFRALIPTCSLSSPALSSSRLSPSTASSSGSMRPVPYRMFRAQIHRCAIPSHQVFLTYYCFYYINTYKMR